MDNLEARQQVYRHAAKTWGNKAQMEMAIEEALEFALAVRKQLRKKNPESFDNLIEEFADIEIMLEQIEMMHSHLDFRSRVDHQKAFKVDRLNKRLNAKSFEATEGEVDNA